MKKIYPTGASILISEDCNLRCKYCFECHNNKHMTEEVAKQSINFLIDNALKMQDDHIHLMLFGGEPLINYKIVKYILEYGYKQCRNHNLYLTASMVTNCTVMNPEIEMMMREWINKIDFSVQLSIDGKKETQDMFRVTKGGQGSFDLLEKNIPIWQDIFRHKPHMLCVHGCCNENTIHNLYENYLYFREELNFKSIWFIPIASDGWTDKLSKVYEEQLTKISNHILNKIKETNDIREISVYAPIDKCMNQSTGFNIPCGAGRGFVTITADGNVYPCHHFYFNDPEEETYLGNIFDGLNFDKKRIFDEYSSEDLSCSKNGCDCYDCYRCIAESWCRNGSILSFENNGFKCDFAKIEKKIFNKINKEIREMGLLNNTDNLTDKQKHLLSICDNVCRSHDACNIVVHSTKEEKNNSCSGECTCGTKDSNEITKKDIDIIHMALTEILNKLNINPLVDDNYEINSLINIDLIVDKVIEKLKTKL